MNIPPELIIFDGPRNDVIHLRPATDLAELSRQIEQVHSGIQTFFDVVGEGRPFLH